MAYSDDILALGADHHWKFDGDALDAIGSAGGTNTGGIYTSSAIAEDAVNCWSVDTRTDQISIPDQSDMGNTIAATRYAFGGWFEVTSIQPPPVRIYGQGNATTSISIIMGWGNNLMFEVDVGTIVQVFGDRSLVNNRAYHLFLRFSGNGYTNEFTAFLDGTELVVAEPSNKRPDVVNIPTHSANRFGDPVDIVSVGGATVKLVASMTGHYNHWATFSGAAIPTNTEIVELFEKGAIPAVTISTDTEVNMQTALDTYATSTRGNAPLAIRVQPISGGGDFILTANNITFDSFCSIHVQYTGVDTLTWINDNGSSATIFSTPAGGAIISLTPVTVTINVKTAKDQIDIQNVRILIEADSGGPLPSRASVTIVRSVSTATVTHTAHGLRTGESIVIRGASQQEYNDEHIVTVTGTNTYTYTISGTPNTPATGTITATAVVFSGITNISGVATGTYNYRSDQPVIGNARYGSGSMKYSTSIVAGVLTLNGFTTTILLVSEVPGV